ncbi:flavin reductase family protein [Sphingopyxis sp.]|uniref:flavin reductase family protein n=1 Tax=Sphingopyxis sp. TaxID=1908224 RepID=UPI0026349DBA|nr:flavin reductase family protein [Sphingopyxis sp.]MCW0200100.1 flavin reductase family protein [Sphingopyxis sp.]
MPEFDQRSFRSALGRFATGVTIITARGADGRPVGVTANSFNSVSLDPPLVLWSLARTSSSLEAYESAEAFAIHILGIEQEHLSNRFATKGADKFEGMDVDHAGVPLLDGCAARFHCRKVQRHEVGDHILFIGEVVEFEACDGAPLLYVQGKYGEARRREAAELSYDLDAARLGKGAILNLFSHAYVRILGRVRAEFEAIGLQQAASIILGALAEGMTALPEIRQFAIERDYDFSPQEQQALVGEGLIAIEGGRVALLPKGHEAYGALLAALKTVEDHLVGECTPGELSEARHFLARIGNLDSDF